MGLHEGPLEMNLWCYYFVEGLSDSTSLLETVGGFLRLVEKLMIAMRLQPNREDLRLTR